MFDPSQSPVFHIEPSKVSAGVRFATMFTRYGIGDKVFRGPNTPYGALMTYYLKEKPDKEEKIKLEILDSSGTIFASS